MKRSVLAVVVNALVVVLIGVPMTSVFGDPKDLEKPVTPGVSLGMVPHYFYQVDYFWVVGIGGGVGIAIDTLYRDIFGLPDIRTLGIMLPDYRVPNVFDVRSLDTGVPVTPAEAVNQFNIKGTSIYPKGDTLEAAFHMGAPPTQFPIEYRISFDLSKSYEERPKRCLLCMALPGWLRSTPAFAQGINQFAGPGFQEDVVLFARLEGPGRAVLRARTRAGGRAVPGTVKVEGKTVEIEVRWAALNDLGVARAAMRVVLGVVGAGMFDRVPSQGSIQLGMARGTELRVVSRFTLAGEGPPDLFYYDTNGNGMIDAAARDTNRNGRIEYMLGEGPFAYVAADGRLEEFSRVEQRADGRRRAFLVQNEQLAHVTIADDKDGDGRIGAGEFTGYYLPKR